MNTELPGDAGSPTDLPNHHDAHVLSPPNVPRGRMARISEWLVWRHSQEVERIIREISSPESLAACGAHNDRSAHTRGVDQLLEHAWREVKKGRHESAWFYLDRIKELKIYDIKDLNEVQLRARLLDNECCAKIKENGEESDWRRITIHALLRPCLAGNANQGRDKLDEARKRLYLATVLRDEHFMNIAYKTWVLRASRNLTGLLLLGVTTLLSMALFFHWIPLIASNGATVVQTQIIGVVLFGMLGASFSTLRSLTLDAKLYLDPRIPRQALAIWTALMRLLVGGCASLVAYMLLLSQAINLGILNNAPGLYVVGFLAGFSDNFVIKGLGAVERTLDSRSQIRG